MKAWTVWVTENSCRQGFLSNRLKAISGVKASGREQRCNRKHNVKMNKSIGYAQGEPKVPVYLCEDGTQQCWN